MTALEVDDLAVVTGPLVMHLDSGAESESFFTTGVVVKILYGPDPRGDVWAESQEDGTSDYIALSSLTPLAEIQNDPEVQWGDLLDPNYVHDYVYEGEDE